MAQGAEFPLRKPPGFHYDFFLLGVTTFIAGLIGVPAPNGLIPQAPIHTNSLVILGRLPKKVDNETSPSDPGTRTASLKQPKSNEECTDVSLLPLNHEVPVAVVEQRLSNFSQGSLCLVLLTGPFLHVLSLIPRGELNYLNIIKETSLISRTYLGVLAGLLLVVDIFFAPT